MSTTKGALKAAKIAFDAHKYDEAERQARSVLESDPKHYTATVFLGLALEKQGKVDEAEKVYIFAKATKPKDVLALQGLISIYEQQAARKVDEYGEVARQLASLFAVAEDQHKCQSVVNKYVEFAKQHGTRTQYRQALEIMLPESSIYEFLEGRLPHPSSTYPKVIEIIELEESQRINKLIGERRTRLGAKIGNVTTEVKLEVYKNSNIERLYQQIIDWTNEDDIRRMYEERLLQRAYDTLAVFPTDEKAEKRVQVQKLAEGMVILKHPFALAWNIAFEWLDYERIQDFDATLLRTYIGLFPDDGLTKVLEGYLESNYSPFPKVPKESVKPNGDAEDDDHSPEVPLSAEDRLIMMSEGLEQSGRSITSQRFMTEYYLALEEYPSVIGCAKKTNELLDIERGITGLALQNSIDAANVALGTALVQFESPRNHPQARRLFESVLERKPTDTAALIGLGLILEEETEYQEAIEFFERVLQRSSNTRIKSEAAWCRSLMGDYAGGLKILRECLEELQSSDDLERDLLSLVHYRIGNSMWNIDTSKTARKDRNGAYSHFLASLKANVNYAPAYTSLGYYYADYAKDRSRARKCFQKAFELSISEVDAARRLAELFADQKDWELVEAVSQRVVESGKVRPPPGSKKKGISWPFAALGVCQLNNQEYAKSIVSFQSALRTSPEDFHSWIGLGESYHSLGRYIAATKAFEHALGIQSNDDNQRSVWFSRYMLANVKRELGYFEDAITAYDEVLIGKPEEVGVIIALLQTYMEHAWSCVSGGFFGAATDTCIEAINIAGNLVKLKPATFNLWKSLADVCSIFSWAEHYSSKFPSEKLINILKLDASESTYDCLEIDQIDFDTIPKLSEEIKGKPSYSPIMAAILCQKRAVYCAANDIHAQAVAWYNLGWIEYRASSTISTSTKNVGQYKRAAVQAFKRAIELESGNAEFWDALGIVTTGLNPKVAQHSFVRSLHLNDRSAKTWTNLGVLYLLQNDFQLAYAAFTRGQSTDPEYAHAWLGQGILALSSGDLKEASAMFTHAFEIADSTSLVIKRLYSSTAFDNFLSTSSQQLDISDLLQPLFALHQLKSQRSNEDVFSHLSALVSERLGDYDQSQQVLEEICSHLEEEYEASESIVSLAKFSQAKADLARACLANEDLDAAIENAETSLDLSAEENLPDPSARTRFRLSAHLTAGLAHSLNGNTEDAISMFREALKESDGDPDVVTLLSQVLWAKGGKKEHDVAREQLFSCIELHADHAGAISLLAVVAILDDDKDTLDAVAADLQTVRIRKDLDKQQKSKIEGLLSAVSRILDPAGDLRNATISVMLEPWSTHGWSQLTACSEDDSSAQMALVTASGAVPPKGSLDAEKLAAAFAESGIPADAQKGIMLAPWYPSAWEALA